MIGEKSAKRVGLRAALAGGRGGWARAACCVLALFTVFRMARLEGWDDAFYVAQLGSAVGDGDLRLHDDLLGFANPLPLRLRSLLVTLPDGALVNTFSVGPAVIHSAYTWPLLSGGRAPGPTWRALVALGSLLLLVACVGLTAEWLRELGYPPRWTLPVAALSVWWGPLALYGTRSYLNAHLPAAACAAGLLWAAQRWVRAGAPRQAVALGLAAGLLTIVRWQDLLLVAALAPVLLHACWADRQGRRARLASLALAGLVALAVLGVQGLAFRAQFGSFWLVPQGAGYMHWSRPALLEFVLSPFHGLLPWAPGFALALAGLWWARRQLAVEARPLANGLLAVLPLVLWVSAAPRDWWGGDSFGPRRLATLTPLAALGLAAWLRRLPRPAGLALVVLPSLWSVLTVSAFLSGFDDLSVLFTGRPSASNPLDPARYAGLHWIDRWGPLHALKPGFTFSDAPGHVDRIVGVLAVAACLAVAGGVRRLLRRRAWQHVLLAGALAWLAVWLTLLARAPSNAAFDGGWQKLVQGRAAADPAWPADLQRAARVVTAFQAARVADRPTVERLLAGLPPSFVPIGADELWDLARSAAGDRLAAEAGP